MKERRKSESFPLKALTNPPEGHHFYNPAMYNSVYLHSGEFVHSDADMVIPGRGFDFALIRTYRSQGIYSGVLGWGWDHNYNKRLLEMPGGDILYFDGTGRRERYKAQKAGSRITGYTVPEGWFTQLKKKEDGTFRLIYPDLTVEYYDGTGMLIKIRDRNDNCMEFYYDIAGQMTAVMDTMGRMIDLEYYPLEFEEAEGDPQGTDQNHVGPAETNHGFQRSRHSI